MTKPHGIGLNPTIRHSEPPGRSPYFRFKPSICVNKGVYIETLGHFSEEDTRELRDTLNGILGETSQVERGYPPYIVEEGSCIWSVYKRPPVSDGEFMGSFPNRTAASLYADYLACEDAETEGVI